MENEINIAKCYLTENDCYKTTQTIKPAGIMVHSTGANNPYIKRYVQPAPTNSQKNGLLQLIGVNKYSNDWNHPNIDKCVHAFIGKDANEIVRTVQTLPWTKRGWHAGSGKKGSFNDTHISFEICEDGLNDSKYFEKVMDEAQRLCAYLCKLYKLDPTKENVIICHIEGYRLGKASQHGDIEHWLKKFGLTMDWFRERVNYYYNYKEETNMDDIPRSWGKNAVEWSVENKISNGINLRANCSKEEVLTILYRYHKMMEEQKDV